jgi:hypothetical protein
MRTRTIRLIRERSPKVCMVLILPSLPKRATDYINLR